jgi:hypothetical protein
VATVRFLRRNGWPVCRNKIPECIDSAASLSSVRFTHRQTQSFTRLNSTAVMRGAVQFLEAQLPRGGDL